jgi:hypothetical protein
MKTTTYASVSVAASSLIEACAVAHYSFDPAQANRFQFRAEEMLKKIADELGFNLEKRMEDAA